MIIIYIISLLILIAIPCSLYFEKLGDFFSKIKKLFIKLTDKIKQKQEKEKQYRKRLYEDEINNLKNQICELEKEHKKEIEELLLKTNVEKQHLIKLLEKNDKYCQEIIKNKKSNESEKDIEINDLKQEIEILKKVKNDSNQEKNYWEKGKRFKCRDGEKVRSKSERDIDDFLYLNRIWHIYESEYQHPLSKQLSRPDFYLPDYNLYIEYFGMKTPEYLKKREEKIKMYNSDDSINFEYLTYEDDKVIYEKLKKICIKYSIPMKK
ncbi:MAG: hypothetical protein IKB02_04905 [Clostridia bacterium]|nr:hypothetical protein [Clostridia bacterium]MBR6582717.1 hypothetical protein [Treponema sp.]